MRPSRSISLLVLAGAVCLAFAGRSPAQVCHEFAQGYTGAVLLPDDPRNVVLLGTTHAVVAAEAAGTLIVDIGDPASPVVGAVIPPTAGWGRDVIVVGTIAYLAEDEAIRAVDLSDPASPTPLGQLDTHGRAERMERVGDLLYVADLDLGLVIVDISVPGSPALVSTLPLPSGGLDVTVHGDHAYVCRWSLGLHVIDVSDPAAPALVNTISHWAQRSAMAEGYLCVVDGSYSIGSPDGFKVYSLADPASPQLLGWCEFPGNAVTDIHVSGDRVRVGASRFGIITVDTSDPANPAIVGFNDSPYAVLGFAEDSGRFIMVGDDRLHIASVEPESPLLGTVDTPNLNAVRRLAFAGPYAFAPIGNTFRLYDVSDPADPSYVSLEVFTDQLYGGAAFGSTVVFGGSAGVHVFGFLNPANPSFLRTIPFSSPVRDVVHDGGRTYAANGVGLQVMDVNSVSTPVIGSVTTPDSALAVVAAGDYAYVADQLSGLQIVDVSYAPDPVIVGSLDTPGAALTLVLEGSLVYLCDGSGGLHIIDVSDPTQPDLIGTFDPTDTVWRVAVIGDFAYVDTGSRIIIVDISDLADPTEVGTLITNNQLSGAYNRDGNLLFADYTGLYFTPPQCAAVLSAPAPGVPPSAVLRAGRPNPFRVASTLSFTLDRPGRVAVSVYDVQGRLVRTLVDEPRPAGTAEIVWDGRDDRGRSAPAGAYTARLAVDGTWITARRLVRLR